MNKLMIGLAVGLGTFAIAEASKAIDAKKAKAKAEAKAKADAKQKAKRVVEQRAAAMNRAKLRKDLEQTALEDKCIVPKSIDAVLGTYVIAVEKAYSGLAAAEKKMDDAIANSPSVSQMALKNKAWDDFNAQ